MNWWDNLKPGRAMVDEEREEYGRQLYEVVMSKTATEAERVGAYRAWLKVAISPYLKHGGAWRGKP